MGRPLMRIKKDPWVGRVVHEGDEDSLSCFDHGGYYTLPLCPLPLNPLDEMEVGDYIVKYHLNGECRQKK